METVTLSTMRSKYAAGSTHGKRAWEARATPNWRGNCRAQYLERAPEDLIPRLRGSDAAHNVLAVADIEIELGEELLLR